MALTPGIHPRDACRPTDSQAERDVWAALKVGLPAGWYGWHSLRVRDPHGYEGEGDFVLAHPDRGLLVLEVKGGRVEQRDGRWFQNGQAMPRAPLDQGKGFAKRLTSRLRDLGCGAPAFGAAVCLPDTIIPGQPSQDDLAVVIDEAQDLHDEAWLLVETLARGRTLWAFHDPGQGYWPERKPPAELFSTTYRLAEKWSGSAWIEPSRGMCWRSRSTP